MSRYDFDLITLGAGSGGVRATRLAGGYGAKTAIVEKSRVGGTCVMRGCVPKKLLVYAAHFAEDFEDAAAYGWSGGERHLDWAKLVDAKDAELERLEGVYRRILRDNNVELIEGNGQLVDPHTVEIEGRRHTAEKILIATGGWPAMPDIPGIEHVISSNEALDLKEMPQRIVIVGGGYIAVEFAGIFNAVGVEVTQIIRAGNLLRGFDADVREFLAAEMEKKGITILRDTVVRSIAREDGGYSLRVTGQDSLLETDLVMYATGRAPNTRDIGLEQAGVSLDSKGAVVVDDWNRSSVDSVFAVGDATDRINLTPVAIAEGVAFAETLFNDNPRRMDYGTVPSAVFSQPPVGTVGLTELEAHERCACDVYLSTFKPLKHTITGRPEQAMMKVIVEQATDRVIGCHMVGADAPEIMQGLAIAMKCGGTKAQFDATVGIHPTAAEEFVTMRDKRPQHDE